MQSMELMFDKNLIQALGITAVLVGISIVYLQILNSMLKSRYWPVAMMFFFGLFVLSLTSMINSFQAAIPIDVKPYIVMLVLKLIVVSHGIYYITVELGRFQGLRNTAISLEEHEIFIVLSSISLTNIMINLHTIHWATERIAITVLFNILFIYLAVKIVYYIGDFKYYLIYAVPMLLAYTLIALLDNTYNIQHSIVSSETQVAMISTLVIATSYLFILMRFQMVDSRKLIRQYEMSRAERNLKTESSGFKFKEINEDIDKRLEIYKDKHSGINLNEKITNAINERETENDTKDDKDDKDIEVVNELDTDIVNDIVETDIEDKSLEDLEKELGKKLEKLVGKLNMKDEE